MRGPLSSEAVQILCGGFPAHPPRRRLRSIWPISDLATDSGRATRNTSSEPEAEGVFFSLHAGRLRSGGRRDVIRSTIYSGSPGQPDVATKLESKGRHHSMARQSAMGTSVSLCCGVVHLVVTPTVFA